MCAPSTRPTSDAEEATDLVRDENVADEETVEVEADDDSAIALGYN
ncbi:hypothetical protein [Parasphingorhabdus pacifica]